MEERGGTTRTLPIPKPPPPIRPFVRDDHQTPARDNSRMTLSSLAHRCNLCGLSHYGPCLWSNEPRQPQEPPPEEESSSETYSDEYLQYSSEEEQRGIDVVQHGPWLPREDLPTDMQPQDGAFNETSLGEAERPRYRPQLVNYWSSEASRGPEPGSASLENDQVNVVVRDPYRHTGHNTLVTSVSAGNEATRNIGIQET